MLILSTYEIYPIKKGALSSTFFYFLRTGRDSNLIQNTFINQ